MNIHTIKPLDVDLIAKAAAETGLLITVEEHSIIGGLGAAVAEAVCDTCPVPVVRIGVNDEYGHAFGDEVLIEFARILERNLIADGIAVRFGGEEFMLILPDVTEDEIRHMLAKMSADYRLFGKQKKNRAFTFSCGVEQFADGMDVSDVYRQADEKLYLAKERGRDRVIINR